MFRSARAGVMAVTTVVAVVASLLMCAVATADAQTCLGYPAFATGPMNLSVDGVVGGRFWGSGVNASLGGRSGGTFGNVGVGTTSFIDDPKETRISFGGTIGYEQHTQDRLIWCPLAAFDAEQGQTVTQGTRHWRTAGTVIGGGVGVSGELAGRGILSINPFVNAQFQHIHSAVTGDSTSKSDEDGVSFAAGLGIRLKDAVEITPYFSGATFEGSDLVFVLRISVALEFRKK